MDEKDLELIRKGVGRCKFCELTRKKIECPRFKEDGFCEYEIEKLSKIEDFEKLQEQIVFSLGEMLVLLVERIKVKNSLGPTSVKEIKDAADMLSRWITGTRSRQRMAFEKRDLGKLLSGGDEEKDE